MARKKGPGNLEPLESKVVRARVGVWRGDNIPTGLTFEPVTRLKSVTKSASRAIARDLGLDKFMLLQFTNGKTRVKLLLGCELKFGSFATIKRDPIDLFSNSLQMLPTLPPLPDAHLDRN